MSYATSGVVTVTLNAPDTAGSTSSTPFSFALPGSTTNQNQVAAALTTLYSHGGNAVTNALLPATTAQAYTALAQLAGSEAVPFRQIAQDRADEARYTVAWRLVNPQPEVHHGLWVTAAYQRTSVNGMDDALAPGSTPYVDNSAALTLGYDQCLAPNVRAGAAFVFSNDNIDYSNNPASARIDGVQGELYGSWSPLADPRHTSAWYVAGIAGFGYWNNRLTRTVTVDALSGQNNALFNTSSETLYGEAGAKLLYAIGTLQPYAGLTLGHYAQQGATESGSASALTWEAASTNAVSGTLGVRFIGQGATLFGHALDWQANLAWVHALSGTNQMLSAAFASAPGTTWQVWGTPLDRDAVKFDIGASLQFGARMRVFTKLGVESGTHTHDYGGLLGAQWTW